MPTSKRTEFLVTVTRSGRATQHWFAPSESLRGPGDTDAQAALLAANEWHWDADYPITLARSSGNLVTRSV